uniref:allene oxide synthase-lipoxygenase protein-like n=1 Tax=Ciona intestinalis TaxID=7719 RepID=UPI000180C873|nr:allene oxide synthase-lipoxygenase protein-like [Ciona intestinalis]|eukprot:XP_002122603.3 allene oxide synthase-lipoxygenase protein-like [Ciona intestinalis]
MGNCFKSVKVLPYPTTQYKVSVKTTDGYHKAGTDSTIYLELVGTDGMSTDWVKLDNFLKDDFEKGQENHFEFLSRDIGAPIIIRIKLEDTGDEDEWLCSHITVTYMDNKIEFPVYEWIEKKIQFTTGKAMLPQKVDNPHVRSLRHQEIDRRKGLYLWVDLPTEAQIGFGLPRYVNVDSYAKLPKIFQRSEIRQAQFAEKRLEALFQVTLNVIGTAICPIEDFDSFKKLYRLDEIKWQDPDYINNWDTDIGMGRQVLTGISPLAFEKYTKPIPNFDVTNDDVSDLLEGRTLEEAMQAGKLYVGDYSKLLADVERRTYNDEPLHCANSIGLFYVNTEGQFLPIAIQLVAGDRDYLFTPSCNHYDWLLAKMYFRCSHSNVHQWVYHYLYTHAIIEPFTIALFRCLPSAHPIYKLLRPHLRTVVAINTEARLVLIPPNARGGQSMAIMAAALARKQFKTFHFDDIVIPKVLKKLGTDDSELLPNFYYRDDALALWSIMEKYVESVVRFYYTSDEDVKEDFELQGWAKDVAEHGLGWQDGNTRGFPTSITNIEQLIEICVTLMFTSSAQHAAVNFGQFETYKFIPNATVGMRQPPHKKGEATLERVLESLPDATLASLHIAVSYTLSQFSPDEAYLGTFAERLFTETEITSIQENYRQDLAGLEQKIVQRNEGLEYEYSYLQPSRVPESIAI